VGETKRGFPLSVPEVVALAIAIPTALYYLWRLLFEYGLPHPLGVLYTVRGVIALSLVNAGWIMVMRSWSSLNVRVRIYSTLPLLTFSSAFLGQWVFAVLFVHNPW
jgi:hypothetical protein